MGAQAGFSKLFLLMRGMVYDSEILHYSNPNVAVHTVC